MEMDNQVNTPRIQTALQREPSCPRATRLFQQRHSMTMNMPLQQHSMTPQTTCLSQEQVCSRQMRLPSERATREGGQGEREDERMCPCLRRRRVGTANESQLRLISRQCILHVTFRRAHAATGAAYTIMLRDGVSRLIWYVYTHIHT